MTTRIFYKINNEDGTSTITRSVPSVNSDYQVFATLTAGPGNILYNTLSGEMANVINIPMEVSRYWEEKSIIWASSIKND